MEILLKRTPRMLLESSAGRPAVSSLLAMRLSRGAGEAKGHKEAYALCQQRLAGRSQLLKKARWASWKAKPSLKWAK